uniref:Peptidase S8/S53 domain-containing protein n=1 Tax=Panagrolaimus davidi TaxID=227884 RepID=A0A914Q100_9BILA
MRLDTIKNNDEIFTIGSLFTSEMKLYFETENDDSPSHLWYYSSKGPTTNGLRGITLVAPGSAIVENSKHHSSNGKQIFHETSCAAPIAAGAIACLLSALKANSIKYNPAIIKMALCNTAFLPENGDQLGYGNGIIQIDSAFEYLKSNRENLLKVIFPQISIKNKSNEKGIVIYKIENDQNIYDYCINIKHLNIQTKNQINWILKLSSEKENQYIEYSKTVTNDLFNVKIDTKDLKPGNYYYSEIQAFDPSNLSLGSIFYLPITIIAPEIVLQKKYF